MKLIPTTAAALVAGLLSLPLAAPAFAQADPAPEITLRLDRPERPERPDRMQRPDGHGGGGMFRHHRDGGPGNARFLSFGCGPNSAERLEVSLVRASHRLNLTDTQTPLFEDFRTAALTAQTELADVCAATEPSAETTQTLPQSLQSRIAVDTARIEAWNAVLPSLNALYDSLDDTQKAMLDRRLNHTVRQLEPLAPTPPADPSQS
jgi:hypothetical protein